MRASICPSRATTSRDSSRDCAASDRVSRLRASASARRLATSCWSTSKRLRASYHCHAASAVAVNASSNARTASRERRCGSAAARVSATSCCSVEDSAIVPRKKRSGHGVNPAQSCKPGFQSRRQHFVSHAGDENRMYPEGKRGSGHAWMGDERWSLAQPRPACFSGHVEEVDQDLRAGGQAGPEPALLPQWHQFGQVVPGSYAPVAFNVFDLGVTLAQRLAEQLTPALPAKDHHPLSGELQPGQLLEQSFAV